MIRSETSAIISQSTFNGGQATEGGAIYLDDGSTLEISDCTLEDNSASVQGGAIHATYPGYIKIENSRFLLNKALSQGSNLYVAYMDTEYNLTVENTKFTISSIQYNSLSIKRTISYLNKVLFYTPISREVLSTSYIQQYGQGLQCSECLYLAISNSIFNNYVSDNGGALSIITPTSIKENYQGYLGLSITSTKFNGNIAKLKGGAIYLENTQNATISECSFTTNQASSLVVMNLLSPLSVANQQFTENSGEGGAIYYVCDPGTQTGALECNLKITSSSFMNNNALIKGGAIHNFNIEPEIDQFNMNFTGNKAGSYGNLFSSEAHQLVHIPESALEQVQVKHQVNQETINQIKNEVIQFKRFKSGSKVETMYFGLIDLYGNLITTDSKAMLFVKDISITNLLVYAGQLEYGNSILGTFYTANQGIFTIDSLQLSSSPNSSQLLQLVTNDINSQYKYNKENLLNAINISVDVRNCLPGEEITIKGECYQCPENTYLLENPTKSSKCLPCKSEFSICLGGNKVYPKPGYWRSSEFSDNFIQCRNLKACLGGSEGNERRLDQNFSSPLVGACYKGFQGILCADCDISYQTQSGFKCAKCPDPTLNVLKLIAIYLFVGIKELRKRPTIHQHLIKFQSTTCSLSVQQVHLTFNGQNLSKNYSKTLKQCKKVSPCSFHLIASSIKERLKIREPTRLEYTFRKS
ncbi:hypothetical protein FGO68_gene17027 [Halteria grandinella]|uniref:Uncharacterized protein n=1 Tax=Halteria grandinella TaxID=5974 RepID=A0A8J8SUX5_HALGN|nr:hypothetical protein FGO68_gene17027 [Halteria grandinella]